MNQSDEDLKLHTGTCPVNQHTPLYLLCRPRPLPPDTYTDLS